MDTRQLFENELRRRDIKFDVDAASGRHALSVDGWQLLVSLENLDRSLARDGDMDAVARFVDTVLETGSRTGAGLSASNLYWAIEPNDHEEPAQYRVALSDRVDRVLVHKSTDDRAILWIDQNMLYKLGMTLADAERRAFENLEQALQEATVEWSEIDGVRLAHLTSTLPFKASLLLAPNLRDVVEEAIGWPLLAVAPARDFLFFWSSEHADLLGRVGRVTVDEFKRSAYPISTEVFEISDSGCRAIGEFPTET